MTLEIKTLDVIFTSLLAGAIFNNYDLACLGMALYQSVYMKPVPGGLYETSRERIFK